MPKPPNLFSTIFSTIGATPTLSNGVIPNPISSSLNSYHSFKATSLSLLHLIFALVLNRPTLRTIQHHRSDCCPIEFAFQFKWYFLIACIGKMASEMSTMTKEKGINPTFVSTDLKPNQKTNRTKSQIQFSVKMNFAPEHLLLLLKKKKCCCYISAGLGERTKEVRTGNAKAERRN